MMMFLMPSSHYNFSIFPSEESSSNDKTAAWCSTHSPMYVAQRGSHTARFLQDYKSRVGPSHTVGKATG